MEEDRDKPFVGIYTGLALRRGERKRGLSVDLFRLIHQESQN